MKLTEGHFYHIYNRGNNQQKIFFKDANYLFFLDKIKKEISPYCDILSYSLMPNHFHLEVFVKTDSKTNALNNGLAVLLRSYTRAIQKQENIKGSLFQQKTKAKELNDQTMNSTMNQLAVCMHYIHQNSFRAGLVKKMEDWPYSSVREYLNMGYDKICNTKMGLDVTEITEAKFLEESYQSIPEKYLIGIEQG